MKVRENASPNLKKIKNEQNFTSNHKIVTKNKLICFYLLVNMSTVLFSISVYTIIVYQYKGCDGNGREKSGAGSRFCRNL